MNLPSALVLSTVSVTTSGTANTVTTGTLLAALGVGIRYRLWLFGVFPTNTAQAVVNWRLAATDSGALIIGASGATFAAPAPAWIPGGHRFPVNTLVGYSASSALISLVLTVILGATVEYST